MRLADARRLLVLAVTLALLAVACSAAAELATDEPTPQVTNERLELKTVTYRASLGRDPFALPDFSAGGQRSTKELDLRTATLVGVVQVPNGFIALVEDENGDSYALLKGDPVRSGRVSTISDAVLIGWMRNGDSRQQIRLELVKEGE